MNLTNKWGLPQTLMNYAMRNTYSRGNAHISVTQLINSPRIRLLNIKHGDKIVEDLSDRLWSLIGTALHEVVQKGADNEHLAEERLFLEANGWRVSGGIDLQRLSMGPDGLPVVAISDYKLTSAWSVMNPKQDWERQLNCYAHLVREVKGYKVDKLSINAIIRDWNRNKAKMESGYPPAAMQVIDIPVWAPEKAEAYFNERVAIHQQAEALDDWQQNIPPCTAEERWYRPGELAVMKDGRKRALKLFEAGQAAEAEAYAKENKAAVVERPGKNVKCEDFCAVSEWCEQWQALKPKEANDE